MLGGGVFVTQNKVLPGSYINIVSAATLTSAIGERGVVAIALPIGKDEGNVIELTANDFVQNCETILGVKYADKKVIALREIFRHATKVYLYDLGTASTKTVSNVCEALEPYEFNILCAYTNVANDITTYIAQVKAWRDEMGKKCQLVVYNTENADYEGVINVASAVSNDGVDAFGLVAWVAGAQAGCAVNKSCTNMIYDGEYTVMVNKTQSELEECLANGQFVFHNVYGSVRVLEDINSLTTTTDDKSDDFKNNQTIRVVDQAANDVAKLYNTKYLGKIPNNASGRESLWGEIVEHHRELERIMAIENFNADDLKVERGSTKTSVVVTDAITPINCMARLYMTIVVQ